MKPSEVKTGDVFRITMNQANGITPKAGDDSRDKYYVYKYQTSSVCSSNAMFYM